MAVTAIKRVENRSSRPVAVFDIENANVPGNGRVIEPGDWWGRFDMWVPWAARERDFAHHHLRVDLDGTPSFWLWQADTDDGDFIRYSTDGAWHRPGDHVPGAAIVGGDRTLLVGD